MESGLVGGTQKTAQAPVRAWVRPIAESGVPVAQISRTASRDFRSKPCSIGNQAGIRVRNLILHFGALGGLKEINFDVNRAELLDRRKTSDSGKSTPLYDMNAPELIQGGIIGICDTPLRNPEQPSRLV